MNNNQQSLFGEETSCIELAIKGRRVGFIGKFKNRAALERKVIALGANEKSKAGHTKDTQILVIGADAKQEDLNKLTCYQHDGFHPLCINAEQLEEIFNGKTEGYETPAILEKRITIDMSYYDWQPPAYTATEGDESLRVSSPMQYGEKNPIYGMEIYLPKSNRKLAQLIGNFGGYANAEFFDETNVVMLPDATLEKLRNGERDEIIRHIEDMYNNSTSTMFNVKFTCEHDFVEWASKRLEKYPDPVSLELLNALK